MYTSEDTAEIRRVKLKNIDIEEYKKEGERLHQLARETRDKGDLLEAYRLFEKGNRQYDLAKKLIAEN